MIRITITNGTLFKTIFVDAEVFAEVKKAATKRRLRIVAVNVRRPTPGQGVATTQAALDGFED